MPSPSKNHLRSILFSCALATAAPAPGSDFLARLTAESAAAEAEAAVFKVRLEGELKPAAAKIWGQIEALAGLSEAVKETDRQKRAAVEELKKLDPTKLRTREEVATFDRLTGERVRAERAFERAAAARRAAAVADAAESEEGRRLLEELRDLEARIRAAEKTSAVAGAMAVAAKGRLKFYTSPEPPPAKQIAELKLEPPRDATERVRRFGARNSPESIAELAREFFSRVDVTVPGLERAESALAAGDHAGALDAWRDYFFAKLREPLEHGLPANWGGDLDTASWLRVPVETKLEEAMRGTFSTPKARAEVGPPGAIPWGAPGPDHTLDPLRNPYLDFYTTRGQGGFVDVLGPHLVLLNGYAATGERRYLDRWAEVLDDWAMHAPGDMERSPFAIRQYPVLCSFRPVALASTLTDVLDAQPGFAELLPAPTLARVMLTVMEEYPAAFVRLARRGIYNWRCIAMTGAVLTAQVFPEFHAARWQLGEAKRLMESNWSHKILRDGSNLEQGNWGHEPNDQVHLGRAYRLLEMQPPAWMDDAWRAEWRDNMAVNARYYLHMIKPDGFSYRFSRVNTADKFMVRGRFDDPEMPIQSNLLLDEPEARRRLEWIFDDYATEPPGVTSESLAYFGAAIFRGGWEPDASFLYFQSSPHRNCNGREDANGFALHGYGHAVLLAPPFAVDGRTQNIHHGLVPKPGGKTIWLTYDDRGVPVESRFHASPAFDFAEGEYRGVYQLQSGVEAEIFGDYGYAKLAEKLRAQGDEPIRDVAHRRQVLSVRGEDVVIVVDRWSSAEERTFSQHYTMFTPVPREGWKRRVELAEEAGRPPLVIDDSARLLRTDNHGLPGVSVRHFGSGQPAYSVTDDGFAKAAEAGSADEALALLGSPKLKKWTMGLPLPFSQKVRADWTTRGEQLLVTALATRPGDLGGEPFAGDLRDVEPVDADGAVGFRATTARGKRIEYLAGRDKATPLRCGAFACEGEALLVVSGESGAGGIALGCARFSHEGKAHGATGDFEFAVKGGNLKITPIYRPIQPVDIAPEVAVFRSEQRVELSCPTPGVEIRYTLDGSEPDVRSPLYHEPFTLTATTRVKARAFRTGLEKTPWTADGTHATATTWATFEKEAALPSVSADGAEPGVRWEYLEGRWTQLFAAVESLPAIKTGASSSLLDVSMRATDGAFALRVEGLLNVPADGVYTFHSPHEWVFPDGESGYDLRIYVHGREWQPATRRHAHGTWSIALQKGAHPFRAVFTDLRPREPKAELWDGFPNPDIVWKGGVPTLEVSGPGITRQALPEQWLMHVPGG